MYVKIGKVTREVGLSAKRIQEYEKENYGIPESSQWHRFPQAGGGTFYYTGKKKEGRLWSLPLL